MRRIRQRMKRIRQRMARCKILSSPQDKYNKFFLSIPLKFTKIVTDLLYIH